MVAPQRPSGALARWPAAGPHRAAIDEDLLDAGGRQGRLGEAGAVDDAGGVEHAEIGIGALCDKAAPGEPKARRRQPRHLAHRLLQAEQADHAAIMAEDAREGAP